MTVKGEKTIETNRIVTKRATKRKRYKIERTGLLSISISTEKREKNRKSRREIQDA